MKRINQNDLLEAAEAVAQITGQSHIFIVGMAGKKTSTESCRFLPAAPCKPQKSAIL